MPALTVTVSPGRAAAIPAATVAYCPPEGATTSWRADGATGKARAPTNIAGSNGKTGTLRMVYPGVWNTDRRHTDRVEGARPGARAGGAGVAEVPAGCGESLTTRRGSRPENGLRCCA